MALPKRLAELQKEHRDLITEIEDETRSNWGGHPSNDGYWIYLRPGWIYPDAETHFIHEYTVKECLAGFKRLQRCTCEECVRLGSQG